MKPKIQELSPKMRAYIEATFSWTDKALDLTARLINQTQPDIESANRVIRNLRRNLRNIDVKASGLSKPSFFDHELHSNKRVQILLAKEDYPLHVPRAAFWHSLWLLLRGHRPRIAEARHYIQSLKQTPEKSPTSNAYQYPNSTSNHPTHHESQQSSDEKGFPLC